jgi:predicted nucleic acid-binding protein
VNYLIDSDWVIDYLLGEPRAVRTLSDLRPAGIAISVITYLEVVEGIVGARDSRQADAVFRALLGEVDVLDVTRPVARRTAAIRADLRRQKRPIVHRALDLLIAGTAIEHDLSLLSRNTRDFVDIPDLRLYEPV